jgi:hypothetical protein
LASALITSLSTSMAANFPCQTTWKAWIPNLHSIYCKTSIHHFHWRSWNKEWIQKNDRCGGLYKINKNDHICLYVFTNQKRYTTDIISTFKSNLHYFSFKKSLILICLVAPFLFKLNNNLPTLTMFAWSLLVMWTYIHESFHWL